MVRVRILSFLVGLISVLVGSQALAKTMENPAICIGR